MIVAFNDSDVLVEPEDRACQQERLRHIVEQPGGHIVDFDHLLGYERDTAHDEQHRTSVLRDFESRVFHSVITLTSYFLHLTSYILHHSRLTCCAEDGGNDVTDDFQNCFPCLVHNRVFFM